MPPSDGSLTRRGFLGAAIAGTAATRLIEPKAAGADAVFTPPEQLPPELAAEVDHLEPFFNAPEKFRDVSRGTPLPHSLSDEKKRAAGMTRETWQLEIISDPEHPSKLLHPLSAEKGTALDFEGLMKLAERHAVRFAKTMTCLNIGCPLGTGIWEGVPLREILWRARPRADVRRVFYHGYHNEDPKQVFQSSLPVDRVLEDPFDLPPVILCYKLNGEWLDSERGGPVRVVVPESYGFKSIKWVNRIFLSNLFHANDTYANGNNDVDSTLKTFASATGVPNEVEPGRPIAVTGYAQVGTSGLSRVQVWIEPEAAEHPPGDPYFASAPWRDAYLLPPPDNWGAVPGGRVPAETLGFDPTTGRPTTWPMRLTKILWAALLPGQPAGTHTLRSRTIDAKGQAQPMPRPFQKSGHAAIETVKIRVTG